MRPTTLLLLALLPAQAWADCVYTGAKRAYIECIYGEVQSALSGLFDAQADITSLSVGQEDHEARITALEGQTADLYDLVSGLADDVADLLSPPDFRYLPTATCDEGETIVMRGGAWRCEQLSTGAYDPCFSDDEPLPANANFESGAVCWSETGTAFTGWPFTTCGNAGPCFGLGAHSRAGGEAATGSLTSRKFTIQSDQICWKSGGGQSSYTAFDVGLDGTDDVVVVAYGTDGSSPSFDSWHDQCADVSAYIGQQARIRLVDNDTASGFAWAAWDSFTAP